MFQRFNPVLCRSVLLASVLTLSLSFLMCSQHNPDAALADERDELLQAGPWCFADLEGNSVLECDGRAQSTLLSR